MSTPASLRTVEPFSAAGFDGQVVVSRRPRDLAAAVARLTDPGAARETLHWGRNYLYAVDLDGAPVVVKQFRHEGVRARWRRRLKGSKAAASWRIARALEERGVGTPAPVMLLESRRPTGPSFYVSREVEERLEIRYLFRALAAGREAELFPEVDVEAVFAALGAFLRRMHDAGVRHRDVSIGNLLLTFDGGSRRPEIAIVDLNRARLVERLGVWARTRDLTRLPIVAPELRRVFLDAYWRDRPRGGWAKELLFRTGVRLFLLRNQAKAAVRRPFRALAALRPRRAYPHIPPPPGGAPPREKVVWDRLSDQPHQHAGRLERLTVRLADAGIHLRTAAAAVGAAPRILSRYRELGRRLYAEPVRWDGVGVATRPWPDRRDELLQAIDDLGVDRVLIRLHPWQSDHTEERWLARALAERGVELAFALPQNRELVRDLERWRASIERIAGEFVPFGRRFQIGQAVNRSKWGVWNWGEYLELAAVASEVLRSAGDVEILGPSVIDFELHHVAGALNLEREGVFFDAVSSLLYVDRRGAPENRQLGFDTVDKVRLLKAIAETAKSSGGRCWITEFNWPLWEGPHSPAGRHVAVDETTQADYLVRFYLLALGTGLVERAYWWQIGARGYGLVSPAHGELRRRPSFAALATLARTLDGATFHGPLAAEGEARLYRFTDRDGGDLVVAWSAGEPRRVRLPRPAVRATGRDGEPLAVDGGDEVEAGPSPAYLHLAVE